VTLLADDCLARNAWICGQYLRTRRSDILTALGQHVTLTVVSVAIGVALAVPLALLARRIRGAQPVLLGLSTAIYTIPSLAMFAVLLPFTGLTEKTVVIGLVLYSLTILIRNVVAGLDGVPPEVLESARGMGLGPTRMLLTVELPLALPTILAGVRVATVSTVALVTVGAIIGYGGLGNLIYSGLNSLFKAQVLTASVLCVLLAVLADVLLLGVQRLVTPWARGRR
jgi:osmoprotectant transport system permease protein